jgi:thiamine transport system ATP-binding protein
MGDDFASVRVEGVSFSVPGREILHDVSLDTGGSQTTALIGPSGCGKSTLLRVIAGLAMPQAGRVAFSPPGAATAEDVSRVPPHRRGFGMMFQEFALFPHLDAGRNIAFGLRHSGLSRAEQRARVAELLELVNLPGHEKRTIETLSGGERQRVALARALAPRPRLLMLDEPLGSLDRALRERLLLELKAILARLAIPSIYVTHDQLEAFAIADRVAIMDDGRIVRTGTPREIYSDPGTVFVARFLGMENIIPGTSDGHVVRTALREWPVPGAPAGPVHLLLRADGATLAEGPGPGRVSGEVVSTLFQGDRTRLRLATPAGELEFTLETTDAPSIGATAHLQVPNAAVLTG